MQQRHPFFICINHLLNPIVITSCLISVTFYYLHKFQDEYFILAAITFLLAGQYMDDIFYEIDSKTFWKKNIAQIFFRWFIIVSLILMVGYSAKITEVFSRQILITWFIITPFILIICQWFARHLFHNIIVSNLKLDTAIIVGINDSSISLAKQFNDHPVLSIKFQGFFDDRKVSRLKINSPVDEAQVLGRITEVSQYINKHKINNIYIALPLSAQPRIQRLMDELHDTTVSIYFVPDVFMFNLIQAKARSIHGIPVFAMCESPFLGINSITKRISDITLSSLFLLVFWPIFLLIAIGIKLTSPGNVIFSQRRYGLDGKEIIVYKFRTMTVCEDGETIVQTRRNDSRVTPFGGFLRKTSLDELPQFINVLQGQMSIVGPRPHAVSHNEMYRGLIKGYMIRHKVKPGITGWAQVNGFRGETNTIEKMESRIKYDLEYLRDWSLFLDLLIILKTAGVVIKDQNAY